MEFLHEKVAELELKISRGKCNTEFFISAYFKDMQDMHNEIMTEYRQKIALLERKIEELQKELIFCATPVESQQSATTHQTLSE